MKVGLDANVIAAAFAARGLCADLFCLILREHELVLSQQLLAETEKTLRTKIKLPEHQTTDIIEYLRSIAQLVEPFIVDHDACRDSSDLHVLGLLKAQPLRYFITGDEDLLILKRFHKTKFVKPRDGWVLLQKLKTVQ